MSLGFIRTSVLPIYSPGGAILYILLAFCPEVGRSVPSFPFLVLRVTNALPTPERGLAGCICRVQRLLAFGFLSVSPVG
ncbi:hypothetical protein QBC35DRAFT_491234 [Podospora australis]|uniref:Uncharacterized protein n=1 Tax=Podospora australis TaxID=1536484 RepID=A0AAN7AIN6_9PEZI|nr:hypothetical protein QBC35DRAFT_491234 [Podospora australis]